MDEKASYIAGLVWGSQYGMQWYPTYKMMLNKEIKAVFSNDTELLDYIKTVISELLDQVKDIVMEVRCGPYYGYLVQIKGIFIKARSCHYRIGKHALWSVNTNIFGGSYKIIPKEMRKTMNTNNRSGFDYVLLSHNEFVNKYCAIPIKLIPNEFRIMKVNGAEDDFQT